MIDFTKPLCSTKLAQTVSLRHAAPPVEGTPVALGRGASMTFLHVDGAPPPDRKFNQNSLVTLLALGGTKVLLMGDAEARGRADPSSEPLEGSVERYLLDRHRDQLRADILVVGHHGSKTSSRKALIDAVAPRISIISSGPMPYGSVVLPDAEIVDELSRTGQLFRTDLDDAACAVNPQQDRARRRRQPGGCDNVQVRIDGAGVQAGYARLVD
jgi:competence protein ComEC